MTRPPLAQRLTDDMRHRTPLRKGRPGDWVSRGQQSQCPTSYGGGFEDTYSAPEMTLLAFW